MQTAFNDFGVIPVSNERWQNLPDDADLVCGNATIPEREG
jgi:hypothetical protein